MSGRKKAVLILKLKREAVRVKPRAGVKPSKPHKDKSKYQRKPKHAKKADN